MSTENQELLTPVSYELVSGDPEITAISLLNCHIVHDAPWGRMVARITETELYTRDDAASHSFRGKTDGNAAMFGSPGEAYVYLIYGVHCCFNIVCEAPGAGSAVLVRSAEPVEGVEHLCAARGLINWVPRRDSGDALHPDDVRALTGGPGRLCKAMSIDRSLNGKSLLIPAHIWIAAPFTVGPAVILKTPRIGITRSEGLLRRYLVEDERYTSRRSLIKAK